MLVFLLNSYGDATLRCTTRATREKPQLAEQAAELKKTANASGGDNVTGQVKKKNASDHVSENFRFNPNDEGELAKMNKAVCMICLKTVVAKDVACQSSTSALSRGSQVFQQESLEEECIFLSIYNSNIHKYLKKQKSKRFVHVGLLTIESIAG